MKYTETKLATMASPISQSEEEKCKNAIRMVMAALQGLDYTDAGDGIRLLEDDTYSFSASMRNKYSDKQVTLLVQGSYANKTNIRGESDVDVAVILESTFTSKYRPGVTRLNYGFSEGTYSISTFKDDVEYALKKHFGTGVSRHDKSIKISGNTYRVDADVVPAYRYRDYSYDFSNNPSNYIGGIEIRPDSGGSIINFPEQHIRQGRATNKETGWSYQKCVRIIKNMKNDMITAGISVPSDISSFGLESLMWNVANVEYTRYATLRYKFDDVLNYLKANFDKYSSFKEANGIKKLFSSDKTRSDYQDFITNLSNFYEYDITEV